MGGSASLRQSNITVTSDGEGKVVLKGKVASERAEERAVRIAERTSGVVAVDEKLDVDESLAKSELENMDDDKLAERVAGRIAKAVGDASVKKSWFFGYKVVGAKGADGEWKVDVDADDGRIELDGDVSTNARAMKMLNAAREDPAVRSVENDIDVEEAGHLSYAPAAYRYGLTTRGYGGVPATLMNADGTHAQQLVCHVASASEMAAMDAQKMKKAKTN